MKRFPLQAAGLVLGVTLRPRLCFLLLGCDGENPSPQGTSPIPGSLFLFLTHSHVALPRLVALPVPGRSAGLAFQGQQSSLAGEPQLLFLNLL